MASFIVLKPGGGNSSSYLVGILHVRDHTLPDASIISFILSSHAR